MQTNFEDVQKFHNKFQVPRLAKPGFLSYNDMQFRLNFLWEELDELNEAYEADDLEKAADALVDLVYVALGTADMMGLPWQRIWDEVQRANMSKVRASNAEESLANTGRGNALDVIKPPDWVGPDHSFLLEE